jgi:hypothetical protein
MAATAIYRILGRGPSSAELVQKRPKVPKQPDAFRKFTRPGTEPGPGPGLGPRPGPGPGPVPGPERGLELELELESNSSKTVQMAKYAKRETAQSHRLDPAPYRFRYKNIDVLV